MFNNIAIGPITIHMYGVMIAAGFLAALLMTLRRGKKRGYDEDIIWGIFFCAIIGGMLGTRILYYIVEIPEIMKDPSILWDFKNGYVVYGGIIGGIFAGWLYCRIKKLKFLAYFDLMMPSIALAQGFGRIGCFLAGCCYGKETSGPLAVTFTSSDFAPNNIPLIPTQIYSSILDFVHFLLLLYVAKHKKADGQVAACYLIFYSIGRFIIEFFRGDIERGSVGSFSTSQFISIFTAIAGIIVLFVATVNKKDSRNYHKK